MELMLDAPVQESTAEDQPERRSDRAWLRTLKATSTRRALLLTALGGLLIAGVITALPGTAGSQTGLVGYLESDAGSAAGAKGNAAFDQADAGECLNWDGKNPDGASLVDCKEDHRFEVAESVDMRTFPGSEYGPDAAPPSPARIQQITQEQCQAAVRRYLGPKFDPNSRFVVSMLWSGDKAWRQSGERRILCGLQLAGPDGVQLAFKGKVADVDQSKVWPAGTCVGIDPASNQPTDTPVDCAAPHAMEVTGAVNLAEKFPGGLPAEPDQDGYIKDACTKMTDAYMAPIQLRATTLTLTYNTISLPSWSAGSHQVACSIGATLGNGGWATLLNGAKGPLLINGQPPIAPPDIPQERLNLPPIPMPDVSDAQTPSYDSTYTDSSSSGSSGSGSSSSTNSNQHLPGQTSTPTTASAAPTTPPPPQGNTFNPPPPGAPLPPPDAPLPPADVPPPADTLPPMDAPLPPPPGPVPGPVELPPPA
jgi:predicted heme/steroid binding protein